MLRQLGVGLAILAFTPLATLAAYLFALNQTFTEAAYMKDTLAKSGMYSAASLSMQNTFVTENEEGQLPTPVQQALTDTLTPSAVQSLTEPIIDSVYAPNADAYTISNTRLHFAPLKERFEQNTKKRIGEYVGQLRECSQQNIPDRQSLLELNCRPPGIDKTTVTSTAASQALLSLELPSDTMPLGNVFGGTVDAQTFISQFIGVLRAVKVGRFVIVAFLIASACIIVFASRSRRGGIHRLTTLLLTTALLLTVTSGTIALAMNHANFGGSETLTIESALGSALRLLGLDVFSYTLYFAAAYGIVGIVMLIALYATKKRTTSKA